MAIPLPQFHSNFFFLPFSGMILPQLPIFFPPISTMALPQLVFFFWALTFRAQDTVVKQGIWAVGISLTPLPKFKIFSLPLFLFLSHTFVEFWQRTSEACKSRFAEKKKNYVFWLNIAKSKIYLRYKYCSNLFSEIRKESEFRQ